MNFSVKITTPAVKIMEQKLFLAKASIKIYRQEILKRSGTPFPKNCLRIPSRSGEAWM